MALPIERWSQALLDLATMVLMTHGMIPLRPLRVVLHVRELFPDGGKESSMAATLTMRTRGGQPPGTTQLLFCMIILLSALMHDSQLSWFSRLCSRMMLLWFFPRLRAFSLQVSHRMGMCETTTNVL